MSIESIIGFVVIALLSSLFKDKGKQQPKSRMAPTVPPKGDRPDGPRTAPKEVKRSRNLLEEMLQEFQREPGRFSGERRGDLSQPNRKPGTSKGEKQPKVMSMPESETVVERGTQDTDLYDSETIEAIETSEIPEMSAGKETVGAPSSGQERALPMHLTRQSILNGIIMSEILGKPKGLRNRL